MDNHQARQQAYGYRRGFVLGLTLAEAALLLLFVIMLLLVIGFERRDRLLQEKSRLEKIISQLIPPGSDPAEYLSQSLPKYAEIQKAVTASGGKIDDDFIELIKAVAASSQDKGVVDVRKALADKQAQIDKIIAALKDAGVKGDIKELVTKLSDQDAQINNQRGQITDLRARLGSGIFPNCWTREDGKFDYILDVVLTSNGIKANESVPSDRNLERSRLPLPPMTDTSIIYSESEFLNKTRALYNWSVINECRFYVSIYDGTQSFEKDIYKKLMLTVEGHFYKRQLSDAPPF